MDEERGGRGDSQDGEAYDDGRGLQDEVALEARARRGSSAEKMPMTLLNFCGFGPEAARDVEVLSALSGLDKQDAGSPRSANVSSKESGP